FALVLGLESVIHPDEMPSEAVVEALEVIEEALNEASELSPTVGLRLVHLDGHYAVVPHGAGILDQEVVDANLVWLEAYPDAARSFQDALQTYGEGDKARYRNVLDNLRFALEQVLKGVL